jgi:hypothetical protein
MPGCNTVRGHHFAIGISGKLIDSKRVKYPDPAGAIRLAHFPILKTTQNIAYDFLQLFRGALSRPKRDDFE